ncbi:hypothetical protein Bca4012_060552 [Brassica carinata]
MRCFLAARASRGKSGLCEGLNLDKAPLTFDVGDDIIRWSPPEHRESDQALPNGLLVYKNYISVTDSNFTTDNPLEVTSPGEQDCTSYHQSGSLLMNIKIGLSLPTSLTFFVQIHSNITGHESTAADYQDCGMSAGFIMSNSPWESNIEVGSPHARNEAKLRYKEKKL